MGYYLVSREAFARCLKIRGSEAFRVGYERVEGSQGDVKHSIPTS